MLSRLSHYALLLILIWTSACGGFFVPDEGDSSQDAQPLSELVDTATKTDTNIAEDFGASTETHTALLTETSTDTDTEVPRVRTPYDGIYRMLLSHEEAPNANNNFMETHAFFAVDLNIDLGQGLFSIAPNTGQQATVDGELFVNESGEVTGSLQIQADEKELFVSFQNGRATGGLIRGDYVQQEIAQLVNGSFSGVRQNFDNLTDTEKEATIINDFDGLYQIEWRRNGQERLHSCIEIKDGLISQNIPDGFSLLGAVDPDGGLALFSTTLSSIPTNGEGQIDEEGQVQGIYYVESGSGQFSGERVEQCTVETLPVLSTPDITKHSLCVVENDAQQNTSIPNQSFLSILLQLSREPNKLYCQPSDRCEWLDQSLRTFDDGESCEQECQRQNGECLGRNNNRPRAVIEAETFYDVGALVEVDGSPSFDVNGDVLAYHWEFVQLPPESQVTLLQPSLANPNFRPDLPGVYQLQLIVHDGIIDSVPERITVMVSNTPAANAGTDHSVLPNVEATLDGSLSSDVNGDELTYLWRIVEQPEGSDITLNTPNEAITTWIPTTLGHYLFELTVSDGVTSHSDQVRVKVNSPPVIVFEGPSTANANELVVIDASKSFDPDQDPLQIQWTLAKPAGSNSVLNRNDMFFSFTPDIAGSYNVQLTLNDGLSHTIRFHTLTITAPVANAGADQSTSTMRTTLDGTASFDPEGSALTYQWEVIDSPTNSRVTLNEANTATPSLEVSTAGDYMLQLTVSDEYASSRDTMTVQASLEWELVDHYSWLSINRAAAFVLNDQLWIVGGGGSGIKHEIWRSNNGEEWDQVVAATLWESTSILFQFDNKIWVIGHAGSTGSQSSNDEMNEVWNSSDGIHWNLVPSNLSLPFTHDVGSSFWFRGGTGVDFDGKAWLFPGGETAWSSPDGAQWTEHPLNVPSGIRPIKRVTIFDGKIWAFSSSPEPSILTSSNGVDWEIHQTFNQENKIFNHGAFPLVYQNEIWLISNDTKHAPSTLTENFETVWRSKDGNQWHQASLETPWTRGDRFKAISFKDHIWIFGGVQPVTPWSGFSDLWKLNIDDLPEL